MECNNVQERFIGKLKRFTLLSLSDESALYEITRTKMQVAARTDLQREGDLHDKVRVMLDGFAVRYKTLPDAERQIVSFLVPGDMCDPFGFVLPTADHGIATLTSCTVAILHPNDILAAAEAHPSIARALWWSSLVNGATLREWLLNVGRRPAEHRVAHLLCEMLVRLQAVGLATENSYAFPVTQQDLAETTGLSAVHTNRMLQSLRGQGLIGLRSGAVTIPDVERLKAFCGFQSHYLHLQRPEIELRDSHAA